MSARANDVQVNCGNSGEIGSTPHRDLDNAMLRLVFGQEAEELSTTTRSTSRHGETGRGRFGRWEAAGGP